LSSEAGPCQFSRALLTLFLAHADDGPVLSGGLPLDALALAPPVPSGSELTGTLWDGGGDQGSLSSQRWALVAPAGVEGDRLLACAAPLRRKREEEQGAEARVYRVDPAMDGVAAEQWMRSNFRASATRERELPRYLCLLGDLDQVSLDLQQALAAEAFVGRIAFRREDDYLAYVGKVLRWESAPSPAPSGRALFFAAGDDRGALVQPALAACREAAEMGDFDAREVASIDGGAERLLEAAAAPGPGVLFTLGHGAGAPRGGWPSPEQRRAHQGALGLGGQERLTAERIQSRPFLRGGLWFCFACYGAGTSSRSAYRPWLQVLERSGLLAPGMEAVLPRAEGPPFVAALPQAALANPDGPLAFIGHADLAWSFSYQDLGGQSHAGRFAGVIMDLMRGRRAGLAHHGLMRFAGEVSTALRILEEEDAAALSAGRPSRTTPLRRGCLWMTWQDLRAFVLLGDPAVRLPLRAEG
jgi:hypothetical protein